MKLPIKLRTRLFLSISALITVALLGLIIGLVSVLQFSNSQESYNKHTLLFINASLGMRQELSNELYSLMDGAPDANQLRNHDQEFRNYLATTQSLVSHPDDIQQLSQLESKYNQYYKMLGNPPDGYSALRENKVFLDLVNSLRNQVYDLQTSFISDMDSTQQHAHNRATLIAVLLGLVGLAILGIGFATANTIARRFGGPIDSLAKAADQISQGHFDITLPTSKVTELALLSRRFGSMAESLRQLSQTNIEALVAGQRRLQAVLDSIDYGLIILDYLGHIEHANPVANRQLGWDDERQGQLLGAALQRPDIDEAVQRVLSGKTLEAVPEDLQIDIAGETRLLAWTVTPVNHADGRSVGALMVLRDVTEQRAFDRVRNEFVLRASHELRTPVTGMHMAFALLQERLKFPEDSREAYLLQTVDEETHRLVRLINDLLDFSRYQSGLQRPEKVPSEVSELLDQARARHADAARDKSVELVVELLHTPLPRVTLDPAQMGRVLDNLISNALRHTPAGGRVSLQAMRQNDRLLMAVQDNGEGIAYAQQGRVFEPFVQIGSKKGGAGLGLALCKEIIQLHGGRIGVVSRPGQGTQFFMTLPT
ncbi:MULTISPECIES: ATP-binding protein [Pseudomonas]|uniref:histidine kinase n=1 Tax=Pseudomonas luteola TaxID=47886 RepID=A0A2X2F2W8_PSELU|nr:MULTISPECIES: ATP-binding protein [Pseudomonas]AYN92633.1 HAMP domain-containing protein [Pseudomonas sp. LTJR-52]ENA32643.1 PAS domain S-box protein [Pseudomonas sp. HPB0071]MBF8642064.1 PAS domain-containing protein [Pseudomonas zeshuii]MCG7373155.1 ATP-binding protein [Pseudomonas luteola]RRW42845.1 HAMP domain-containing protein [Pseudomonas luteola]